MRHLFVRFILLLTVLGVASPAVAQRSRAQTRINRLLKSAVAYYDNLELEEAERALNEAIDLADQERITGPVVADVYIQRGILSFVRDRDRDAAVVDFTRALRMNDRAQLDPLVSTPQLKKLFDEATEKARRSPPRRDTRRDNRRDDRRDRVDNRRDRRPPPARDEVVHASPRAIKGGKALTLKVELNGRLNQEVYRAYAFYRSAAVESSKRIELRPKGRSAFAAQIPGRHVEGRNLTYYIVLEDRGGKRIGGVASARNPMFVQITDSAFGDVDTLASGDGLDGDGDDDDREYFSLGISLGTGGGFITDLVQPINSTGAKVDPGVASTPLHSLIELDFWAAKWFAISAFARIQIVEFAHLEGGRLKFKVLESPSSRVELRGGGGFGQVRHLINLDGVFDTALQGPYFYTLGLAYQYRFNKDTSLAIAPDFFHMIGTSPSLHFDLSVGVRFGF